MRRILGLDLGTNSIGWALLSYENDNAIKPEVKLGCRIIPMTQDVLSSFDSGVTVSQTAKRTGFRSIRRLRERCLLRRERLLRVLHIMGFLPAHFDNAIGWNRNDNKTYGKFIDDSEPKLAWKRGTNGKMEFVFMDSFHEMIEDFKKTQPDLVSNDRKIPLDWTLYYLRKKALTHAITKEELAWILLNFNQKRGYYQLRGDDVEDNTQKKEEYYELKVVKVEETNEKRRDAIWYKLYLENGWIYSRASKTPLFEWEGKTKAFIITTEYDADGSVKLDSEGKEKRSFRSPDENDWNLQKKRTESLIEASGKTVGSYIYDSILTVPYEKIRGKLVRVVERKFYKQELTAILQQQAHFIPELTDKALLDRCIEELYQNNHAHRDYLGNKDFSYLLMEDILFYQRPLKKKSSLISNCPYEQYSYIDKATGEIKVQHIKCIAKSNPYYQEIRLWQFIHNLRFFSNDGVGNEEVTKNVLRSEDDYERLYNFLNNRKEISQDVLLKDFFGLKKGRGKDAKYSIRWNYSEDKEKKYPCNRTRYMMLTALNKAGIGASFISDRDVEYRLWHLMYSISDKFEYAKALRAFAESYNLPDTFIEEFEKLPEFEEKDYGAYSEKAIKKLLSVMRVGSYWKESDIPESVKNMVFQKENNEPNSRRNNATVDIDSVFSCKGLPLWQACYVVYGRHSESQDAEKWKTPADLQRYIREFKQYSLRNPIVEQCILETLRTVHDLWVNYGIIDEIHVELGRSMKNSADQRRKLTNRIQQNENTNLRIKKLLLELKNDVQCEDVRPYSPMQQEILRLYEEGALLGLKKEDEQYDEIIRISRLASPTQGELIKYKLWLEQKYRSPYTGRNISLTKLFTTAYQIEHIIPQARYFDDSFSNKVICEAEVNSKKSNMLALEFIKKRGGERVNTIAHGEVTIFNEDEYVRFVNEYYASNRIKAKNLMLEEIPAEFVQRQMNDTRYISKVVKGLLSNIVREEDEVESTSKHVISCTGGITDRLKHDWGLNDIWNRIIYPRFERMNRLTDSENFGHWENKEGKRVFQTTMPLELQKGFNKKRIDHRHHAMDALVIALASRNIVSYLNNESACDTERREDLRQLLCDKNRIIRTPWPTFAEDAYAALRDIVVSFKNYVRVINKATNYYEHYNEEGKKVKACQQGDCQWAVRQSLHDQFVFARVSIEGKKAQSAIRRVLDESFDKKKIEKITDTGIRKILLKYLEAKGENPQLAFSPEGVMELNENIEKYNNGKKHQPILKVRVCEALGAKFPIGQKGAKRKKFVQGAPHLFFGIYEDAEYHRSYITMPLDKVIERMKQRLSPVPEKSGDSILKFWLSPGDLVYVPTGDEKENSNVNAQTIDKSRIYQFVSSDNSTAYFLPSTVAAIIQKSTEFESLNKSEKTSNIHNTLSEDEFVPEIIKANCWKLIVDRMGNIVRIIR